MIRLRWYFYRGMDNVPPVTLLAWLGFIAVIWVALALWLPVQFTLQKTESEPEIAVPKTVHIEKQELTQVDAFLAAAPDIEQVSHAIETLFDVAANHHVNVQEVIYRDEIRPGEPILNYMIDFSVQNTYPNIKRFMTTLLATTPYLALEQISFERDSINSSQVKTHFKFKLYLDHE